MGKSEGERFISPTFNEMKVGGGRQMPTGLPALRRSGCHMGEVVLGMLLNEKQVTRR